MQILVNKITSDIESVRFNTSISALMEFSHRLLQNKDKISKKLFSTYVILLSPFAPHMAEEIEQIDVLDTAGQPTGQTKSIDDIHRDEDWHAGAHVWVVNARGELLFQRRVADGRLWQDIWDVSASAHVSAGETSLATALREAAEELGLALTADDLEFLFQVQQADTKVGGKPHNCWDDIYLVQKEIDPSKLNLQKKEVSAVRLIPYLEFEKMLAAGGGGFVPRKKEYDLLLAELKKRYPQAR